MTTEYRLCLGCRINENFTRWVPYLTTAHPTLSIHWSQQVYWVHANFNHETSTDCCHSGQSDLVIISPPSDLSTPLGVKLETCERSFSAMNRFLCSKRSQLTAEHLEQLMFISTKDPKFHIPGSLEQLLTRRRTVWRFCPTSSWAIPDTTSSPLTCRPSIEWIIHITH